MKRRIILITGHPNSVEEKKMDDLYLNYYYNYFHTNSGGAYEEDEIFVYKQPSSTDLKILVKRLKADFAVLVLIGHGATNNGHQAFQINKNEVIKAGQLELNIDKQLILVESCRTTLEKVLPINLNDKLPQFKLGGTKRNPISRAKAKELYNQRILNCNNGVTVCLACSKGERAWNYYFSFSLIQTSFNWHLNSQNHFQTLGIIPLMETVKNNILKLSTNKVSVRQNPEIIGKENFPFSVSKF